MAMMITNFNRLIQSKIVWGLFIGLVVFAFIAMDMATPDQSVGESGKDILGEVFGEDITRAELLGSYYSIYLENTIRSGRELNIDDIAHENLINAAWERIAIISKIRELGYAVSDNEITTRIKDIIRMLSQKDQYDANIYNAFISNFLPRYGMSAKNFEQFIGDSILIEKALEEIGRDVWVDEEEILEIFHNLNDLITVEYAIIDHKKYVAEEVTLDEIENYYDKNPDNFTLPERALVHYIEFLSASYTNEIEISSQQVAQVYSNNIERYRINDSSKDINDKIEYAALVDVEASIRSSLNLYSARQKAINDADLFVASLSENTDFESSAKLMNLKIYKELPSFTLNERTVNDDSDIFNKAAFTLRFSDEEYYSDPVVGRDRVYVIMLKEKISSSLPIFSEVKDKARQFAQEEADQSVYNKKSNELYSKIQEKINDGESFIDITKKNKLKLESTQPYNSKNPLKIPFASEIMSQTYSHPEKTLVPINTYDGLLLAFIKKREIADTSNLEEDRQNITTQLMQQKGFSAIQNWQQLVINEAEIKIF